jgi:DNA-binding protein HU-beta
MNKANLIEFVATKTNMTKKDAKEALEAVIEGIVDGLSMDNKVTLVGFGTFQLIEKAARTARNPKTGEPIEVPAKIAPKFRASAALKEYFEGFDVDGDDDDGIETGSEEVGEPENA